MWLRRAKIYKYRHVLLFLTAWGAAVALITSVPAEARAPESQAPVAYSATVLADGPSLYYRFDESTGAVAHDSSGTGNALTGSQMYWGQAGALANDTNPAVIGAGMTSASAAGLPTGNSARSVEGWVNQPADGVNLASWGSGTNGRFQVRLNSPDTVVVDLGGTTRSFTATHPIFDQAWHQVAVTFDGSSLAAYVDGQALGTSTLSPLATTASTLLVGHAAAANPIIDEVAVYPTALSSTQVAAHFAASGNSRPSLSGAPSLSAGPNKITVSWTGATAGVPAGSPQVSRYLVTANSVSGPGRVIDSTGAVTSLVFSGLPAGVAYSFQVTAFNQFGVGSSVTSGTASATGSATTYASSVQADGPSLYYRFSEPDGTVLADSSGTGNDASEWRATLGATGALAADPDSAAGGTCCGGSMTSGSAAGLPTGNAPRSVELWFQGGLAPITWGSGTNGQFAMSSSGSNSIVVGRGGETRSFTTDHPLSDNAWHYLVVTYDGSTLAGYFDGQSMGTQTFSAALATTATSLSMDFQGPPMDEVALYPTVLTASQVAAHFAASGDSRPTAVTNLAATRTAANTIQVSWTAATAGVPTGAAPITEYRVSALHSGVVSRVIASSGSTTQVTFSGLPAGVTYDFRVETFNQFGQGASATLAAALSATGSTSTYASIVAADGPSLYYRFSDPDGTVSADSSGTGNDLYGGGNRGQTGALVADPDPAAYVGCCGRQFISASSTGLPTGNSARTVEAWVNENPDYPAPIATWGTSGSGLFSVYPSGTSTIAVNGGGQILTFTTPRPIEDRAWHQVVVTYDGNTLTVSMDGVAIGSGTFTQLLATTSTQLQVGFQGPGIDELAVYPAALSPAQIATHFYAGSGRSQGALS